VGDKAEIYQAFPKNPQIHLSLSHFKAFVVKNIVVSKKDHV
jgi:hypothetical protein